MRSSRKAAAWLAAGLLAAAPCAFAEEAHRQLGPHVHGHGTLEIAVEGNRAEMEFTAPGMDIVGFEHPPGTDEEKAAVATALADLKEPLRLFQFPAAAGCKLGSADVAIVPEEHDDGDGTQSGETEGQHDEFRATYRLSCADGTAIDRIDFPFFERFPGSEQIDVTMIDSRGQMAFQVIRQIPHLDR